MRKMMGMTALAGALAAASPVWAAPLTPMTVIANAAPFVKVVMLCLFVAMIVAIGVCIVKLVSGPRLSGGSAYLSGLRLGGPIAGGLGAAYGVLNMCIGLANVAETPTVRILAPGWAEAMMLVLLGLLTGVVAVVANWAVESRIDRTVLRP